jgi:hypothetical protein
MDLELARIVAEDLGYLFVEWNQDIDDASLRRGSTVLRSLLIDGLLSKAARQVNRDIRVMAPAIGQLFTEADLREYEYFQAGGAKYKGTTVQTVRLSRRIYTAAERKASYDKLKDVTGSSSVKLSEFLKQTSFVVKGVLINREEVIKYVANKLGGAHYDSARITLKETAGVSLDQKYALLDEVKNFTVADKDAIYYELLSIGQRIVNSRDIRNLRKQLTHLLSLPTTESPRLS